MAADQAMLIDISKCMGCRGCQVACKQWNQLPAEKSQFTGTYQNPPKLAGNTWTLVEFIEPEDFDDSPRWLFRKAQCFHCGKAACAAACPTGAIRKRPDGVVYIDQGICVGCKNCVEVCPFRTPHYDAESGTVKKCRMCIDRLEDGLQPACATACPTGAVTFGARAGMLQIGKSRLAELQKQNPDARLYGAEELGGLGVMYLLPEKASVFGLPEDPRLPHLRILRKWLLGIIPGAGILGWMAYRFWKDEPAEASSGGK